MPSPAVLAKAKDGPSMRELLQPTVDGYKVWMIRRLRAPRSLCSLWKTVHGRRICVWLRPDLLEQDSAVLTAFRIANSAISTSQGANDGNVFPWLISTRVHPELPESVVNEASPERENADLLWVATGGGKTESTFCSSPFALFTDASATTQHRGTASTVHRYTLRLLTLQQFRRALTTTV